MNEQIKTLAKAAGHDPINKAAMKALGFDLELFAELLIKECAGVAYASCDQGDIAAQSILYEFNIDNARQQK